MLDSVWAAITANTLVLAVLGFLAKSLISQFLEKDVAKFKSNIEETAKSEIEKYKSELEIERIKLQIAYGGIFEKQADVITEIYKKIVDFENKVQSAITPTDDRAKCFIDFIDSYRNLFEYYELNRVLLPPYIESHFEKLRKSMYLGVIQHKRAEDRLNKPHLLREKDFDKIFEQQDKAYEIIDRLPIMKQELTDELRSLIGVNHTNKNAL
jgi:hypothetical protein